MTSGALDAELCRLLARAPKSPYWRSTQNFFYGDAMAASKKNVYEFIKEECFKAYSLNNLREDIRNFLKLCDRSLTVHYELFEGKFSGMPWAEEDKRVIERMVEEGDFTFL